MPPQGASRSRDTRRQRSKHNAEQPISKLPAELKNRIFELAIPHNVYFDSSKRPKNLAQFARSRSCAKSNTPNLRAMTSGKVRVELSKIGKQNMKDFLEANHNSPPVPLAPGITRVCRALRGETLGIFYGSNIFELYITSPVELEHTEQWLRIIPPTGLAAIRQIIIITGLRNQPNIAVHLPVDLSSGAMAVPSRPNQRDKHGLWCTMSLTSAGKGSLLNLAWVERLEIRLPAGLLSKAIEEAQRLYGLGDGKNMTPQRLANIAKTFDFDAHGHWLDKLDIKL